MESRIRLQKTLLALAVGTFSFGIAGGIPASAAGGRRMHPGIRPAVRRTHPSIRTDKSDADSLAAAPYMGWTTYDLQAIGNRAYPNTWFNEADIERQADAMHRLLQSHGYNYINIDSGWAGGYDQYGRPMPDFKKFPDGIAGIAKYVHKYGQKLGIYWIPGVQRNVYDQNPPILGTHYHVRDIVAQPLQDGNAFGGNWHLKIDFSKPGAQAFIDSIASLWASWGIDYLKIDGVGPGSDSLIDDRDDIKAYSEAFRKTGRPVWLELSWRLDHSYVDVWKKYAQGRRITDDIDTSNGFVTWAEQVLKRIVEAPFWTSDAGPGKGWNDFDSMPIGSAAIDGLNPEERRTVATFWAIECAPYYTGDDLTRLDAFGIKLLTNDEVIAVDQGGHLAERMVSGSHQVWRADNGDGTYTVALINVDEHPATIAADWDYLGINGSPIVRDLWKRVDLGVYPHGFSATVPGHGSLLLRVGRKDPADAPPPAAVAGLTSAVAGDAIRIQWDASPDASSYVVYRSLASHHGYVRIASHVKGTSYADRTIETGAPYFYQVSAVGVGGESARSQPQIAFPKPAGQAAVISVDFAAGSSPMDVDEVAGVVPALNWNCAACRYGDIDLADDTGAASGARLLYNAGGTFLMPVSDRPGNLRMMRGYLETYDKSTTTIQVVNLPPAFAKAGYDVIVYSDGWNGDSERDAKFTIGTASVVVKDMPGSNIQGDTWTADAVAGHTARFDGITGDSFTLEATPVSSTDQYLRAPINAIQIVAHSK